MSRDGDYSDEMFTKRLSDEDVEAVLSGQAAHDPELAEIARVLSALDPERFIPETGEKAAEFARKASAVARTGEPAKLAATARFRRGLSLTPRLAPAAVAAILLFAVSGVAVASNAAVPGDALYGIDRALERIGIGNGGAAERIEEASVLTENGDGAEALELLAETFDVESSQASDALRKASDRIRENEAANSEVADMLDWMAGEDSRDRQFGQDVAEEARELGNGEGGEDRGQSGEAPGQDKDT
ncbi:MAG TPA: hypothetical protein VFZ80_07300, partial [Acidimicrobiia bacterium]